ncbi:uncharacterized protein [Triticum aestivum]|uniref:uncharacterized protein n=1 Tax=Triticum aestivum TaxID=4565 RepID=UPI001D01D0FD|nr:uncharacterized protein LOC123101456 [Triticum aestivum]
MLSGDIPVSILWSRFAPHLHSTYRRRIANSGLQMDCPAAAPVVMCRTGGLQGGGPRAHRLGRTAGEDVEMADLVLSTGEGSAVAQVQVGGAAVAGRAGGRWSRVAGRRLVLADRRPSCLRGHGGGRQLVAGGRRLVVAGGRRNPTATGTDDARATDRGRRSDLFVTVFDGH